MSSRPPSLTYEESIALEALKGAVTQAECEARRAAAQAARVLIARSSAEARTYAENAREAAETASRAAAEAHPTMRVRAAVASLAAAASATEAEEAFAVKLSEFDRRDRLEQRRAEAAMIAEVHATRDRVGWLMDEVRKWKPAAQVWCSGPIVHIKVPGPVPDYVAVVVMSEPKSCRMRPTAPRMSHVTFDSDERATFWDVQMNPPFKMGSAVFGRDVIAKHWSSQPAKGRSVEPPVPMLVLFKNVMKYSTEFSVFDREDDDD